jgi:hypothetical protein
VPTKSEIDLAAAVEALEEAGYVADGHTRSDTFRGGSAASPVLGHGASGGRIVTTGGRQRFARPGTDDKATVGRVTVALYERPEGGKPADMRAVPTRDTEALREALGLPPRRSPGP